MDKQLERLAFNEKTSIDYWDKLYDKEEFEGYCYRERMDTVLSWLDSLKLPRDAVILDAGCGAGKFACQMAKRGYKVIGADYSFGMITKASSICGCERDCNMSFFQGNIEALPLKPGSFDVIVCLGVIGYTESEKSALDSLARALKPGGVMAISIVNKARLVYRLDLPLLFRTVRDKMLNGKPGSSKKSVEISSTRPTKSFLISRFWKMLEQSGFGEIKYKTVPWKLLTFGGKEVYPQKMAERVTMFFEHFSHVPVVESFGGMCVFMVKKNPLEILKPAIDPIPNQPH